VFFLFVLFFEGKEMSLLVEDFIQAPSVGVLDKCTKEQLFKIADYYSTTLRSLANGQRLG